MSIVHCKCFDHKDYRDCKLQGTCRKNLHYLWKRAVRIAGKPCNNYSINNYYRVSLQFLQPFSIDSADFPCRDPAISSPCSFYGENIGSVVLTHSLIGQFSVETSSKLEQIGQFFEQNPEILTNMDFWTKSKWFWPQCVTVLWWIGSTAVGKTFLRTITRAK